MATGWQYIGGDWYYFQTSGAMIGQGWHAINGNWFYMYASGAMAADTWIGDSYVNSSGAWVQGKTKVQEGWVQSGSRWWYRHSDGGYTRNGWEMIKGQWYFFDKDGWMVTGWRPEETGTTSRRAERWLEKAGTRLMETGIICMQTASWQRIPGSTGIM